MKRVLLGVLLYLMSIAAYAGYTVVLVHGYLGSGEQWRPTGIVYALERHGWLDAGHLFPEGPFPAVIPNVSQRYLYTVTLPSEASLPIQAQWLDNYLTYLQNQHPNNIIFLVGHSAGGVVARLVTVYSQLPIKGLLTIASPHLGTKAAEFGAWLSDTPFSWFAPFAGLNTINRSENLYWDLVREHPTTPLFALNRRPHPQIHYTAIVRQHDDIVPSYSQDMNQVPALTGQVNVIVSSGKHKLRPADGPVIAQELERWITQEEQ